MIRKIKAVYEQGVLRLREPLSLPEGAEVEFTVTLPEADGEQSKAMEDRSWDALTQLLAECAVETGIPDFARNHDRYLYGTRGPGKGLLTMD